MKIKNANRKNSNFYRAIFENHFTKLNTYFPGKIKFLVFSICHFTKAVVK